MRTEINLVVGGTLKRLRKVTNVSQTELAAVLGLHQTALCRVESGKQSVTPGQLLRAADYFKIDSDALLLGKVNLNAVAVSFDQAFSLPKKYQTLMHSHTREILPLIAHVRKLRGDAMMDQVLEDLELGSLLFYSAEAKISSHCFPDILSECISRGLITRTEIPQISRHTRTETVNGFLHPVFESQTSALGLIQTLVLNYHYYESNFSYEIVNIGKRTSALRSIEVAVTPAAHMSKIAYRNDILGDALCSYKKGLLAEFPKYIHKGPAQIKELACHFRGAHQCLYKISAKH